MEELKELEVQFPDLGKSFKEQVKSAQEVARRFEESLPQTGGKIVLILSSQEVSHLVPQLEIQKAS